MALFERDKRIFDDFTEFPLNLVALIFLLSGTLSPQFRIEVANFEKTTPLRANK